MVVVDHLDEWLDLGSLGLAGFRHTAGDLRWVTLNTGDQCVRVWVRLVSKILRLDNDDLQTPSVSVVPLVLAFSQDSQPMPRCLVETL